MRALTRSHARTIHDICTRLYLRSSIILQQHHNYVKQHEKDIARRKEVDSPSLSDYLRSLWKYGEQLFQVICLAAEDANTRNNQSFAF